MSTTLSTRARWALAFLLWIATWLLIAGLTASPAAGQQAVKVATAASLCTDGSPRIYAVVDATSSTDCATGGGTTDNLCSCLGGVLADFGGGSGGGNSFETMNVDNGTDPVADSSTDTLNLVSGTGITITGDSSTDTITIASTIPDLILDLGDDGGNDSTAVAEIATIYDRYGTVTEPSADKALFDFATLEDRYLAGPPSSPGTPDDEFNAGSLDGKWTAVDGSSGTIDMHLNSSAYNIYDLSTRSGFLLMQVGSATGDDVLLRQDYTLPDGSTVVIMLDPPISSGSNAAQCGIGLNDNDTHIIAGNYMVIDIDQQAAGARVLVQSVGATSGLGLSDDSIGTVALAITRIDSGSDKAYAGWASFNGGRTWAHVDTAVHSSATLDNLWIYCDTRAAHAAGQNDPIAAVDWLRSAATTNLYTLSF